jgi:hypothetical protein
MINSIGDFDITIVFGDRSITLKYNMRSAFAVCKDIGYDRLRQQLIAGDLEIIVTTLMKLSSGKFDEELTFTIDELYELVIAKGYKEVSVELLGFIWPIGNYGQSFKDHMIEYNKAMKGLEDGAETVDKDEDVPPPEA